MIIIYQASKSQFLHHALRDDIEGVVSRQYRSVTGHGVGLSEILAWKHSLLEMAKVLGDDEIHARDGQIDHPHCRAHLERAPLFLARERAKLQAFIREHVRHGDRKGALYAIENGRIVIAA